MGFRQSPLEGLVMNRTFWKDKKVLITGCTGFKGSWLSLWLQSMGACVVGYSLSPPTNPNMFDVARVADEMCLIDGDVRNLDHLKNTIEEYRPEIIIHMAAQSLVRYSYIEPVETYTTNVIGTVNILEAVRQIKGTRVVLIITSDKCYQNNEWQWGYRENEPMGGHDPYSSSKGCAEIITSAYRDSYFPIETYDQHNVAIASARAGNVIGGGDWSDDRLIPDVIKAFMENRPVIVRNPNAVRPWQHVLEPLNGYLCLIEKLWTNGAEFSSGWNFGPSDDVREASWVVERMVELWGENARWDLDRDQNPYEAKYLKLDCSKAKNILKWAPRLDLPVTLEWIIKWYRNYQQNKDMRYYTESEISRYEKLET